MSQEQNRDIEVKASIISPAVGARGSVRRAEGPDSRRACVKLRAFLPGYLGYPKVGGLGHFPEVENHTGPFIRAERPGASYGRCGMYVRVSDWMEMPIINGDLGYFLNDC